MYLENSHPPLTVSPPVGKVDNENLIMSFLNVSHILTCFFTPWVIYPPDVPTPKFTHTAGLINPPSQITVEKIALHPRAAAR